MKKLVLFDIDGTLLSMSANHRNSFSYAINAIYNIETPKDSSYINKYSGMADTSIIYAYVKENGFKEKDIEEKIEQAKKKMVEYYKNNLKNENVKILPGVIPLLEKLKEVGVTVGLVTGNLKDIAKLKLGNQNLAKYFDFDIGGFGSEYFVRKQFVQAAISAADKKLNSKIRHNKIFVVGDTVRDVDSTKEDHVVSISVLTGTSSKEDIIKHNPDHILENLADIDKFLEIING